MKKHLLLSLVLIISLSACEQTPVEFSIDETRVGKLSKTTQISELLSLYASDSIVTIDSLGLKNGSLASNLLIYDKSGKQLLRLSPKVDTSKTIASVRVYDSRFKTHQNIGIGSSFKELKSIGTIDKILPSYNSISVTFKGSSIYYTIDRKQLPDALKYDRTATIEPLQIPDQAVISKIMIQW